MRTVIRPWRWTLSAAICTSILYMDCVFAQTPYYAGKTITLVRGGGPGGSGEF